MFRTLTHQVALLAGIGAAVLLAIAAVIISNILTMQTIAARVTSVTIEQVELSGQVNTDLFRGFAEALSYARTSSPENRASALQEMEDAATLTAKIQDLTMHDGGDPLDREFAALQERRVAVVAVIRPAVADVVQAVDQHDAALMTGALDQLNRHKAAIEQLEEDSGGLLDRSIVDANRASAQSAQTALISAALSLGLFLLLMALFFGFLRNMIVAPIAKLEAAATAVAAGEVDQPIVVTSHAEIGRLQQAFAQMVASLAANREQVALDQLLLETRVAERTADLEQTLAALQHSMAEREQLLVTVRELASPVVPVMDGIIVMPVIGVIDSARAEVLTRTMLSAIEQHRAKTIILDVTGVPIVDTQVAQVLLQAAEASRLVGAQTILVGLRPELVQTIVGLGLDLSRLVTRADLQSGVRYALRRA